MYLLGRGHEASQQITRAFNVGLEAVSCTDSAPEPGTSLLAPHWEKPNGLDRGSILNAL